MKISTYKTMLDNSSKNILVTENIFEYIGSDDFSNPLKIVEFMKCVFEMDKLAEEYLYMIAFNTKMNVLGVFNIFHGTCNLAFVSPREILIRALLCGAANIVITHNHRSGNCKPSLDDEKATERLKKACGLINIPLIDHIIIGKDFYSFKENNNIL